MLLWRRIAWIVLSSISRSCKFVTEGNLLYGGVEVSISSAPQRETNLCGRISFMPLCQYCHKQTTIPCGAEVESLAIVRFTGDHCAREFLVVDDVPVIEDQPGKKKAPKAHVE